MRTILPPPAPRTAPRRRKAGSRRAAPRAETHPGWCGSKAMARTVVTVQGGAVAAPSRRRGRGYRSAAPRRWQGPSAGVPRAAAPAARIPTARPHACCRGWGRRPYCTCHLHPTSSASAMNDLSRQAHWENVYATRGEREVSWFQERPALSLELIRAAGATPRSAVIDVGGGASRLVDALLADGFAAV